MHLCTVDTGMKEHTNTRIESTAVPEILKTSMPRVVKKVFQSAIKSCASKLLPTNLPNSTSFGAISWYANSTRLPFCPSFWTDLEMFSLS
mmetsp:Transcript_48290/g.75429  ORF Transcript_48290/g.75429 Transcript_48290/m.75429 type:complete len:90 (-) Transcript_48290:644-913(-)